MERRYRRRYVILLTPRYPDERETEKTVCSHVCADGGSQTNEQPNNQYKYTHSVPENLPESAGLGAGNNFAPSQPPYQTTGDGSNKMQQTDNAYGGQYDGRNNRDFQSGHGGPVQSESGVDGRGPRPDEMYSGPGIGASSAAPQRLP